MAKGYSLDLRRRVFGAWQRGEGSQSEVAARFAVSVSFVRDLSRRFRASGDVAAKPYGGGRASSVDAATCEAIKALVAARNDATIEEHRQSLGARHRPVDPALVHEDQILRRDGRDLLLEGMPEGLDTRGVSLVVAKGLFLRVSPSLCSQCPSVE